MRRLILLLLAMAVVIPAGAARRVTVAQLEEALAAAILEHRPDADVARQVNAMELSERLTENTLNRFAGKLALQPRTALALQLLADQSAFLDPPAGEFPATAPPDAEAQQHMLAAARAYAVETWSRLPNFLVTRVTNRFDDSPHVMAKGDWPVRAGLQPVGASSRQVTFRDGKEVQDAPTPVPAAAEAAQGKTPSPAAKIPTELGLHTWGEFGPALTVVLADMASHKVSFSHWEQAPAGLVAVFSYAVPHEASHYAVGYSYLNQNVLGRTQFGYGGRDRSPQQVANIPRENDLQAYSENPGYHGAISIDPATGAVLRLTIEAELSRSDPLSLAETMVEYGPVTIGDRQFICPLRSLAVSVEEAWMAASGNAQMAMNGVGDNTLWESPLSKTGKGTILLINETKFTDYHRFGSTARVITDGAIADTARPAAPDAPSAAGDGSVSSPPTSANAVLPATAEVGAPAGTPAAATAPPSTAIPAPSPAAPTPAPVVPEISMSTTDSVPDLPLDSARGQDSGFSLRLTTRLVDVGVMAYDKKGHPVTDLKAEDFEVYDNGHRQEVRFFTQAESAASDATSAASASTPVKEPPGLTFSNRAQNPAGPDLGTKAPEPKATILLIDESHIAWSDMENARRQMLKFLGTLAPAERAGIYSMNGLGFHVLVEATSDHAALIARMQNFMPTGQSVSQAQEEEKRNRQQFEEVQNVSDLNSVNGNHTDAPDGATPVDPQLLTMGSNPARASLIILTQVARHLSALPGHKNLVWVSSDNVFAEWQDQGVGVDKSPTAIDRYALHAQEAMNEAHASVYPFDVSQLEGGAIGADTQHRNVELTPAAADNAALAASGGGTGGGGNVQGTGGRNMQPGRIMAEMSQDLHPIQGSIREVAAATGGRAIRRSSDLAGELNSIVGDGHAIYQLSFAPSGPADDQYHTITVKLAGRRGLALRYRTGYLFQKEPATLKDRFKEAVWRPLDVSEIAVAANIVPGTGGASVKVNIAAADLGMEQQGDRWMDKLDIFFIQRDDAGIHAHLEGQTLGLRLKPSTYQRLLPIGIPYERAVQMRTGMSSLRVLVVDENSGRMGSVTVPSLAMNAAR